MAIRKLPPRDLVRQLLRYDVMTGIFTWLPRLREMFADEPHCRQWNTRYAGKTAGCIGGNGYFIIVISHTLYYAHRLAWLYAYGQPVPNGLDHIDCNPLNNRLGNLRAATQSQNLANRIKRKGNPTGFRGVRRTRTGRFDAHVKCNGKQTYVGCFDTAEEAAEARREAASRLHGEFARHE